MFIDSSHPNGVTAKFTLHNLRCFVVLCCLMLVQLETIQRIASLFKYSGKTNFGLYHSLTQQFLNVIC